MIKKLWIKTIIGLSCVCVMLLTISLIAVFHVATFVRRLLTKKFVSAAAPDQVEEPAELIGSANGHLNVIKASLERQ